MKDLAKKEESKAVDEPQKNVTSIEMALLEIVQRNDIDPDRLEKFLDLQIKMEERQAKLKFQQAMATFQGECPVIEKNKNVKFKSVDYNYSPIEEIVRIIRPLLSRNGLSFTFDVKKTDNESSMELITTVRHSGGHAESYSYFFNKYHDDDRMNQSQKAKSSVTYAKRAALENALGIVTGGQDDDANGFSEITTDQVKQMRFLLKNLDRKEPDFLNYCERVFKVKIKSIEEMNSKQAEQALNFLQELMENKK